MGKVWPVPTIIKYGQKVVMLEQRMLQGKMCLCCVKMCEQCGKEFYFKSCGENYNRKKRFCSVHCAAIYRNSLPHIKEAARERAHVMADATRGKRMPCHSVRMREHNPMKNMEARERARLKKVGKPFAGERGGNGKFTKPQILLMGILGLPAEYPIPTKGTTVQDVPNNYKADLAIVEKKVAIELDGHSHALKRIQAADAKKTACLNELGWKVLRFWNEEVLNNTDSVVQTIRQYMT